MHIQPGPVGGGPAAGGCQAPGRPSAGAGADMLTSSRLRSLARVTSERVDFCAWPCEHSTLSPRQREHTFERAGSKAEPPTCADIEGAGRRDANSPITGPWQATSLRNERSPAYPSSARKRARHLEKFGARNPPTLLGDCGLGLPPRVCVRRAIDTIFKEDGDDLLGLKHGPELH